MEHTGNRHHSTFALHERHSSQDVAAAFRVIVERRLPDVAEWYDENAFRYDENILIQAVRCGG